MISSDAFGYINLLDNSGDISWQRQTLIMNNIANDDTPGYKRQDIEFDSVLRRELINTHERSLERAVNVLGKPENYVEGIEYTDYENYSYRLDGNNVDMDTENVELASEQLRYQALMTSVNNEVSRFKSVLRQFLIWFYGDYGGRVMGLFQPFDIAATGMTAQRFRMDIIAENIANVSTTRTENGGPYRRKIVTFQEKELKNGVASFRNILKDRTNYYNGNGVKVTKVSEDTETDFIMEYDPSHPDADENGYVRYPNVNTVTEMTNLIDASRSYEANTTAFQAIKSMAQTGIQVGSV